MASASREEDEMIRGVNMIIYLFPFSYGQIVQVTLGYFSLTRKRIYVIRKLAIIKMQ